jgi:hypothetical protein
MGKIHAILITLLTLIGTPLFADHGRHRARRAGSRTIDETRRHLRCTSRRTCSTSSASLGSPIRVTIPLFTFAGYLMAESQHARPPRAGAVERAARVDARRPRDRVHRRERLLHHASPAAAASRSWRSAACSTRRCASRATPHRVRARPRHRRGALARPPVLPQPSLPIARVRARRGRRHQQGAYLKRPASPGAALALVLMLAAHAVLRRHPQYNDPSRKARSAGGSDRLLGREVGHRRPLPGRRRHGHRPDGPRRGLRRRGALRPHRPGLRLQGPDLARRPQDRPRVGRAGRRHPHHHHDGDGAHELGHPGSDPASHPRVLHGEREWTPSGSSSSS